MAKAKHKAKKKVSYPSGKAIAIAVAVIVVVAAIVVFLTQRPSSQKVVATVNGQQITQADLDNILLTVPPSQRSLVTKDQLLQQAIYQALFEQQAAKLGITVSQQEVDDRVAASIAQYNLTEQEFEAKLAQQNLTLEFVKDIYRKQLIAYKLINQTVLSRINVTDTEMQSFYNAYKSQINVSFVEAEPQIRDAITAQKGQQAVAIYVQQLNASSTIVVY